MANRSAAEVFVDSAAKVGHVVAFGFDLVATPTLGTLELMFGLNGERHALLLLRILLLGNDKKMVEISRRRRGVDVAEDLAQTLKRTHMGQWSD